jgi:uncharacterized damage-inducible protein DinB
MKTFFLDLFNYNDHYNDKIITTLNENPANISDRCMKLLSHVLNVHRIWNYKIKAGEDLYERFEIHPIQECHDINKKNHEDSILILDTFDLDRPIQYALSTGQSFTNSIRDLLFHVINHSTYHRGQIATEFRQSGLEPLMTDYLLYKMK